MDQTTPDQATPERNDETEQTSPAPVTGPLPAPSARARRTENRLRAKAGASEIVAWARGWVSRGSRLHRLVAARTLDFAVLGDGTLTLVSTGFFSRRPRRRVYACDVRDLAVVDEPLSKRRRLRLYSPTGPELWIELGTDARSTTFADALVARTRREPE